MFYRDIIMRLPEKNPFSPINNFPTAQEIQKETKDTTPPQQNSRHIKPIKTVSEAQLRFFDKIVLKENSVEDVVTIGKLIQKEIQQQEHRTYSPSYHSGNWKSSLLHNFLLSLSNLYNGRQPIEDDLSSDIGGIKSTNIFRSKTSVKTRSSRHTPVAAIKYFEQVITSTNNMDTNTPLEINKTVSKNLLKERKNTSKNDSSLSHSYGKTKRKKRSPIVEKNTQQMLTPETFDQKLQLSDEQKNSHKTEIIGIKKAITGYNQLKEKNSREGLNFLQAQADLLTSLKEKNSTSETASKNIEALIADIKKEYYSHTVDIEKNIHAIWVAGSPPESITDYIKAFLKTYDDFNYYLWVDENAFGAAKFTSILKQIAFDLACKDIQQNTQKKT